MNIEQEHKICLLILMGLPGSGKTTFSSYLAHCLEDSKHVGDPPFDFLVYVCYDKIINSTEKIPWNGARRNVANSIGEMIGKLKKTKDPILVVNEYMNFEVHKAAILTSSQILIVVDDNMYYRSMRYQYYQIARTHQVSYCQLFLKCDVNTCLQRNFQREPNHIIPEDILLKMAGNLEEPNACNNSWEINSISISSDKPYSHSSLVPLYAILNAAFSHPVRPAPENLDKEQSRYLCISNIIHQADLALRRIIGNTIKERKKGLDNEQTKELFTNLNVKKQDLLQKLKLGELQLPEEIYKGTEVSSEAIYSFFAEQII